MKGLEPELSDELHAKVTTVLVELTAYNVMRLLHELNAERARIGFAGADNSPANSVITFASALNAKRHYDSVLKR